MPGGVRILANAHAGLTAPTECKSLILFSTKKKTKKKKRKHGREHPGDFFPPPTTCWESKMRKAADEPRSPMRRYSCPPPHASY